MNAFLQIFLSILTAMGGFVEIGELVFAMNAGAKFGPSLIWVVGLGTIGIIVYGEMAGRVAAVAKQPIFDWVRERAGFRVGLGTLIAANLVSLMTCTAEIGGIAIVLKLMLGWPYRFLAVIAFVLLLVVIWTFSFKRLERFFGLLGLLMLVFVVAAVRLRPDWDEVGRSLLPNVPSLSSANEYLVYAYFAVALMSSVMMPFETYFYASGAIEDGWQPREVKTNRVVVTIGFLLGSLLCVGILLVGSQLLRPAGIEPQWPGAATLGPATALGRVGFAVALLGMLFAFGGAAVENALTGAYNLSQFLGWPWGKWRKATGAPRFTIAWVAMLALATLILLLGVNPVQVVEYSVVFSVVILPLTYLPLLMAAGDQRVMGVHANGPIANALGWFFLVLVTLAGVAALPLMVLTHGGKL
ncbi:MAG TPA: divalent metal cation transporter [Candidatus Eisenbacteria bacterium]|jgi:Mn2+/Fe2+ NRAMP family transporter|nr:divalent metal cation transporter [Candidatus Eisenbacteria bacterium]